MPEIVFELTDKEAEVLAHIAMDPLDFIENIVEWQARIAAEEIIAAEIDTMLADPNISEIPSSKKEILASARVIPAAERQ